MMHRLSSWRLCRASRKKLASLKGFADALMGSAASYCNMQHCNNCFLFQIAQVANLVLVLHPDVALEKARSGVHEHAVLLVLLEGACGDGGREDLRLGKLSGHRQLLSSAPSV